MDDPADVVEDVGGEQTDHGDCDGQRKRRHREEDIGHDGQQDQDQTRHQELAHAAEVTLADAGDGRHGEEHRTGTARRHGNHRAAIGETERNLKDAGKHQAHEEGDKT